MATATTAAEAYKQRAEKIAAKMVELQALLVTHSEEANRKDRSWAFAGDLAYVEEKLNQTISFLKGEDE